MKAVNHSILKVVNALLVALLGLFGFTNCEPRQEYGTVEAVYAVKGKVTSRADGKPIEGIRVSKFFYTNSPIPEYGTIYQPYEDKPAAATDQNGNYTAFLTDIIPNHSLVVKFEDIDGAANGAFNDTTITVDLKGEQTVKIDVALSEKEN